jgi:DNA polymerase III delta prime subunit
MHAFLLVGNNSEELKVKSEELAKKLHTKIMNFPLTKIEDVRSLNSLLRLSFNEPTLIVSEKVENATEEALNAFLKNLEEPQENIYFALTASSVRKVLPTIVSRCQVIKLKNLKFKIENLQEVEDFLAMLPSQKIAFFGKIGDRNKAIEFIESLIFFLHKKKDFTNMELLIKTRACLKANGNVNLHLLNLVTQYGK